MPDKDGNATPREIAKTLLAAIEHLSHGLHDLHTKGVMHKMEHTHDIQGNPGEAGYHLSTASKCVKDAYQDLMKWFPPVVQDEIMDWK